MHAMMFSAELSLAVVLVLLPRFRGRTRMDICRKSSLSAPVFAFVSTFAGMLAGGCLGEETYSEKHSDLIESDCQLTAVCDPVFSITANAVGECVKDTSAKLDHSSDAMRANYETRISRCAGQTGCAYYSCAGDAMLFSLVNEQKIHYDCQQQTVCKIMSGQPTLPNDNDTCFKALGQQLDFATVPDKATWDQRFTRCGMQTGCAYVNCK
jgi:hypothetical protein